MAMAIIRMEQEEQTPIRWITFYQGMASLIMDYFIIKTTLVINGLAHLAVTRVHTRFCQLELLLD